MLQGKREEHSLTSTRYLRIAACRRLATSPKSAQIWSPPPLAASLTAYWESASDETKDEPRENLPAEAGN